MDSNTLLNDLEEINLPQFDLKETDWDPFEMDLNTLFNDLEGINLLQCDLNLTKLYTLIRNNISVWNTLYS